LGSVSNKIRQELSSFIKTQGCSEREAALFSKYSKASQLTPNPNANPNVNPYC